MVFLEMRSALATSSTAVRLKPKRTARPMKVSAISSLVAGMRMLP